MSWYESNIMFESHTKYNFGYNLKMTQSELEQRNTNPVSNMIVSARRILSSVFQKNLLVSFSRQYHAPMKIIFADNQQKFDSRTTASLYILHDWL